MSAIPSTATKQRNVAKGQQATQRDALQQRDALYGKARLEHSFDTVLEIIGILERHDAPPSLD
jgi:hypothetical protein